MSAVRAVTSLFFPESRFHGPTCHQQQLYQINRDVRVAGRAYRRERCLDRSLYYYDLLTDYNAHRQVLCSNGRGASRHQLSVPRLFSSINVPSLRMSGWSVSAIFASSQGRTISSRTWSSATSMLPLAACPSALTRNCRWSPVLFLLDGVELAEVRVRTGEAGFKAAQRLLLAEAVRNGHDERLRHGRFRCRLGATAVQPIKRKRRSSLLETHDRLENAHQAKPMVPLAQTWAAAVLSGTPINAQRRPQAAR